MGNFLRGLLAFVPLERCQLFLLGDLGAELPLDRSLDLSGLQLRVLPAAGCVFEGLVKLYLSNNSLRNLPEELGRLQALQLLALDFNTFSEVPAAVCRLPRLHTLYLGNNRLSGLPAELRRLRELSSLWLEANRFSSVPPVLCQLTGLKTLHLGNNRIQNLPPGLRLLDQLHSLWLEENRLTRFPPVLLLMDQLVLLDLDRNQIRLFPSLVHLPALQLIIYDHNPCLNAPLVAPGVRRVGRWAHCQDEDLDLDHDQDHDANTPPPMLEDVQTEDQDL